MFRRAVSRPGVAALAGAALFAAASSAVAFDVFLDYDTDGDPNTFANFVSGPVSVPVDVVLSFDAADIGTTLLTVGIHWGYGGSAGNPGCFDVFGSVDFIPYSPLPDSGPFTNISAFRCVCFGRCVCEAEMLIDADASAVTTPGNYVVATLDFSRQGFAKDCSSPVYPSALFETFCIWPACGVSSDPRAQLYIQEPTTAAGASVADESWGRVKALYR